MKYKGPTEQGSFYKLFSEVVPCAAPPKHLHVHLEQGKQEYGTTPRDVAELNVSINYDCAEAEKLAQKVIDKCKAAFTAEKGFHFADDDALKSSTPGYGSHYLKIESLSQQTPDELRKEMEAILTGDCKLEFIKDSERKFAGNTQFTKRTPPRDKYAQDPSGWEKK